MLPFLGGFEKVKVFLFIGLITLASLAFLGTKRVTDKHLSIMSLFLVWTVISYLINQDMNP